MGSSHHSTNNEQHSELNQTENDNIKNNFTNSGLVQDHQTYI